MVKVNELLSKRFKKSEKQMASLAQKSAQGHLSSFSGVFKVTPLTENEEENLRNLLREYCHETQEIDQDLPFLSSITSEVKAINNQAAILHGERIKKAQEILKPYRDGAFSAWLVATYGNRQTPYNFLQYFELYRSIPKLLQAKMDEMPRQALYTLASRSAPKEEKETIIQNYKGETKKELLSLIRERFPLDQKDRRAPNTAEKILLELHHIEAKMGSRRFRPSAGQKKRILEILCSIEKSL